MEDFAIKEDKWVIDRITKEPVSVGGTNMNMVEIAYLINQKTGEVRKEIIN